jgi:RNA polymerase primary sigma factor
MSTLEQRKLLIEHGKEQGYLTRAEINDVLPDNVDSEQVEEIIGMLNELGIVVCDTPPEADAILMSMGDKAPATPDEEVEEEAVAVLAAVQTEAGRTTDPVRMYMREMGAVELLTREGEIVIAKRIEAGVKQVLNALAHYPEVIATLLENYDRVVAGQSRLSDIIVGYTDTAEEVVPINPEGELAEESFAAATPEVEEGEEGEGAEETEVDTGPDPF